MKDKVARLLQFLDKQLYGYKTTETGWNYLGLILDLFFDNSVLAIDFLNIEDYFADKGFAYNEEKTLEEHLDELKENQYMPFIAAVLNILKFSKYSEEQAADLLKKSEAYLVRQGFVVIDKSTAYIDICVDDEIGKGSYCRVIKYAPSVVKKELLSVHKNDEKLKKRLKYEFENTRKLKGCPHIITVYEFDENDCSYLMEEADSNIFEYLNSQVGISKEEKIKIIYDILSGIKYAHEKDIIHRDLHLGNILKIRDTFALSDFGWSKDISIERSMKSSSTEKNNHYFMDPVAAGDLTKMDKQTDIYSVGKIMEYIYTFNEANDKLLDYIIAKCTARDKSNRYKSIDAILSDLQDVINNEKEEIERADIIKNIQKGVLTSKEEQYIRKLISKDELCNCIVRYKLRGFGKVIIQMPVLEITEIIRNIEQGYVESTGYMQFANYDIYGDIAYYVYTNSKDVEIKKIAKNILEVCASYRWNVQKLLDRINIMEI